MNCLNSANNPSYMFTKQKEKRFVEFLFTRINMFNQSGILMY